MTRKRTLFALLMLASAAASSWALVDTNAYRITFISPVDTTFFASNSLDVNIRVYDQTDSPMPRLSPLLTVRTLSGTGGGITLVNAQLMTDNRNGTYSYRNINVSSYSSTNLEIRVAIDVKGTTLEDRVNIYHGAVPNPNGGSSAWKIEYILPRPVISADSATLISVILYNEDGLPWSGQQLTISVQDTNGTAVAGGLMTGQGGGLYTDSLDGTLLQAGADYVIRVLHSAGGPSIGGIRSSILAEAYSMVVLPILIPVTPDPSPTQRPTFNWHPVAGATVYMIQIDTNPGFGRPIINSPLADTFYTPLLDLPVGVVYWRVSSDLAPSRFSLPDSVTILDPNIPVLIPYEHDPTLERRPTLAWYAIAGAATYTVQIDTIGNFASPLITSPTSDTFFTSAIDLPAKTIYWRVRSSLSPTYSSPDTFTILPDSIPMLVRYNGDTVITQRPAFNWHSVSGATYYTIQISLVPNFATTVINTPTTDTFYTPLISLNTNTLYFWRVSCSRNDNLFSPRDSVFVGTPVGAENAGTGLQPLSLRASPNPFSGVATVTLTGAGQGQVSLQVLDVSGRVVKTLALDNARATLKIQQSGIYLIRAKVGSKTLTERILMLK